MKRDFDVHLWKSDWPGTSFSHVCITIIYDSEFKLVALGVAFEEAGCALSSGKTIIVDCKWRIVIVKVVCVVKAQVFTFPEFFLGK